MYRCIDTPDIEIDLFQFSHYLFAFVLDHLQFFPRIPTTPSSMKPEQIPTIYFLVHCRCFLVGDFWAIVMNVIIVIIVLEIVVYRKRWIKADARSLVVSRVQASEFTLLLLLLIMLLIMQLIML